MGDPVERRGLPPFLNEVVSEAIGQSSRPDPVLVGTGGPAGNARLTAWTGLLLLVLSLAELVTLLDVHGLISWHVVIGVLLIPPAALKTASTGWRIVRYYLGSPPYMQAGPPPSVLRLLGPVVVISTLALLGSGLVLVFVGAERSRSVLFSAAGFRVDWITVHQAAFIVWAVTTGLHVLGRLVPALRLTVVGWTTPRRSSAVPGVRRRVMLLVATCLVAAVAGPLVLAASGSWQTDRGGDDRPPLGGVAPLAPAAQPLSPGR